MKSKILLLLLAVSSFCYGQTYTVVRTTDLTDSLNARLSSLPSGGTTTGWSVVLKKTDEAKTANVTLSADNALSVALQAGKRYHIRVKLFLNTANANMDYKYATAYSGATASVYSRRIHTAAGAVAGTDSDNTLSMATLIPSTAVTATTTGVAFVELFCIIQTTTAGTFSFQWAQNTSDAGTLTVLAGSYLEYIEII